MTAYLLRRMLYAIPILIGVNILVFGLFFFVNSPEAMARAHLGHKRVTPEQIDTWKREHSLNLPYFYNGGWQRLGALAAEKPENEAEFESAGEGAYALVVQAPQAHKEAQARRLSVACSAPERLVLPKEFSEDGAVELPGDLRPRRFLFSVQPGEGPPPSVKVSFKLETPAPVHRVVLEFQAPLAFGARFTQTIFWQRSVKMLFFQYGKSDDGKEISDEIFQRMGPSLSIALPEFVMAMMLNIFLAMVVAFYRGTYVDYWAALVCVLIMSISMLFYILGLQVLVGKLLRLAPISGYDYGLGSLSFIALPVLISIVAGIGGSVRFLRTIFLEEINKDYVRTARSKGLPESRVLFVHALKNAMLPILTGAVVGILGLFTGSLVLESFFSIPGMGSFTLDALQRQDFAVVQAMVSLGSFLYVLGLLLTDISYTLVDPRVRLE